MTITVRFYSAAALQNAYKTGTLHIVKHINRHLSTTHALKDSMRVVLRQ
jgi:hypothetical protein